MLGYVKFYIPLSEQLHLVTTPKLVISEEFNFLPFDFTLLGFPTRNLLLEGGFTIYLNASDFIGGNASDFFKGGLVANATWFFNENIGWKISYQTPSPLGTNGKLLNYRTGVVMRFLKN